MISYRQADKNDLNLTFSIKSNSTKHLIEKIWGWDNTLQLDYHKNQFDPNKVRIIIDGIVEVGYISTFCSEDILFIENIILDTAHQGKNIGTTVLIDTIKSALELNKGIELRVLKINERAKKLYERLNFETISQTELHYNMRYKES